MEKELRILVIEDVPTDAELEIRELQRAGLRVAHRIVETEEAFRLALREFPPEIVLSDFSMPHFDGIRALALARDLIPEVPFIFVSGAIGEDYAIHALKNGATDYVLKNNLVRLPAAVERAMRDLQEITERKRGEENLHRTAQRLRLATESARIGIWDLDLENNALVWDQRMYELYGIRAEDFGGAYEAWEKGVHPDDLAAARAEAQAAIAGTRDYHTQFRVLWPDGQVRHIEAYAMVQRDPAGTPRRMVGVNWDITERKRAEEALHEEKTRYRTLFDQSPNGVAILDAKTRMPVMFNEAASRQLGYTGEEFARLHIEDYEAAETPEVTNARIQKMLRGGRDEFETRHRTKTGEIRNVLVNVQTIELSGRPAFHCIFHDITERKRSEEALRAAEEQFRGLVEQSIAGIYIVQDDKLAYVNKRFAEICGYESADELIGRDSLSLVIENDRGAVQDIMRRRIESGVRSVSYGFTARRKDGSTVEVGIHSASATHRGRAAFIGLMQDISEKKRAEEQIQRYVKQLETAFMSTVQVATTLSEMRDPYTAGHERRVAEIAVAIGAELGFDPRRLEGLRVAGYLHDVGKITIPAEILSKPGKLSAIEFQLIQGHPQAGYDVLKDVEFPWPVAEVALQHHERIDGNGYPQGLKGEAILLEARILAVADVIEAMSSHRPYRAGLGIDKALAEIERGRGTAYDTAVADACLKLFREKGYAIPA